jgi:branched-chain amino acid transport system ATP-binding protein
MILEGRGITKRFGGLVALKDVHFHLDENEILGLIGPNGSGKTTLFNVISGVFPPDAGEITLRERNLIGLHRARITRLGIGRTFQIVRPFWQLSVLENVMSGALFGSTRPRTVEQARTDATALLEELGLGGKINERPDTLTLAQRKRLEVARALATDPLVLLLDEVMAGLNPTEVGDVVRLVGQIREKRGIAILLVEHVMAVVLTLCDRVMVFNYGEKIFDGGPGEMCGDREVVRAYLGARYAQS